MAQVINARRYLLLKSRKAFAERRLGPAYTFNTKRRALLGTALPNDTPHRTVLIALGYEVIEELQGADELELMGVGLTPTASTTIVAYVTSYFANL